MANNGGDIWITAAFRSIREGQRYLFMKKECALYYHEAHGKNEKLLRPPTPIDEFFPSLKCTIFAEAGVDCAFASNNHGKAFIFSYDQCAEFDYVADRLVRGPMPISSMFPCLKGTEFEYGIDTAFDSANRNEVYLFKGNVCARVSHSSSPPRLMSKGRIRDTYHVLRGTVFENGFDASYTTPYWTTQQSTVLFKGDTMCHLHFNYGSTNGQQKWGPKKIKDVRPNLGRVLPRKNLITN